VSKKQHFLGVCDNVGTLHILEIAWSLRSPSTNEVSYKKLEVFFLKGRFLVTYALAAFEYGVFRILCKNADCLSEF